MCFWFLILTILRSCLIDVVILYMQHFADGTYSITLHIIETKILKTAAMFKIASYVQILVLLYFMVLDNADAYTT